MSMTEVMVKIGQQFQEIIDIYITRDSERT